MSVRIRYVSAFGPYIYAPLPDSSGEDAIGFEFLRDSSGKEKHSLHDLFIFHCPAKDEFYCYILTELSLMFAAHCYFVEQQWLAPLYWHGRYGISRVPGGSKSDGSTFLLLVST